MGHKGIEAITSRTSGNHLIAAVLLPTEVLGLPGDMVHVDELPDDPSFFVPHFHPLIGRHSIRAASAVTAPQIRNPKGRHPMSTEPPVAELVTRAAHGDQRAWDALVDRYAPLTWSICRRHRLGDADANDIGQAIWLQLVSQLCEVRDPAALACYLATTTERECGTIPRAARGLPADRHVPDAESIPDEQAATAEQELLAAERDAALRVAFSRLPPCCQRLIAMLTEDPPVPYTQISTTLGIPAGSIGPSRRSCLDKLRRDPGIAALINQPGTATAGDEAPAQTVA